MTKKFEKPEGGYTELASDELDEAQNLALDEYAELAKIADEDLTDEQIDRMLELKAESVAIKTERVAREEAAEARLQRIADAKAGIEDDEPAEEEAEGDEPAGDEGDEEEAEPAEGKVPALTASAGRTPVSRRVGGRKPATALEEEPVVAAKAEITVAPDVRGYSAGQSVEGIKGLSEAFKARLGMVSTGTKRSGGKGVLNAFGVATIKRPLADASRAFIGESDGPETVHQKVMDVAKLARKARGAEGVDALTAAAYNGWVTPSENLYDLCQWATFSGGLTLPSITVRRGGLNFTKGIDFADVFNDPDGYFEYTETEMEARPTKPFRILDVPEWEDIRLDSIGYGVKAPIPLRNSFPELLEDYMEKSLVAYQKYVNASVINRVLAQLGSVINAPEYGGATADILQTIEMARLQFIQKYSLADNQTLEAVFPSWVKAVIRADLSRRNGWDNPFSVTDAQIEAWFRARGIRTQYIKDWAGQDLNGNVANLTLPASTRFMLFVPGTFVRGGDEIITLDAIYDQQNLEKNEYIAAFFEESLLVANTCGEGALYEVFLNPYGLTGAAILGNPDS
jgi:hypothetical protein